jgi:hypothetical protein
MRRADRATVCCVPILLAHCSSCDRVRATKPTNGAQIAEQAGERLFLLEIPTTAGQ